MQLEIKAFEHRTSEAREPDIIDDVTGQPYWLRLPEPVGEEWLQYLEERGVYD